MKKDEAGMTFVAYRLHVPTRRMHQEMLLMTRFPLCRNHFRFDLDNADFA
jgi:hypothetical protein